MAQRGRRPKTSRTQQWTLLTDWAIKNNELSVTHSDQDVQKLVRWFKRNFNTAPIRRLRSNVYEIETTALSPLYAEYAERREAVYQAKATSARSLAFERGYINDIVRRSQDSNNPGEVLSYEVVKNGIYTIGRLNTLYNTARAAQNLPRVEMKDLPALTPAENQRLRRVTVDRPQPATGNNPPVGDAPAAATE